VRLSLDGRAVLEEWSEASVARAAVARGRLEAGREHALQLEYFEHQRDAEIRLGWRPPSTGTPFDAALRAARDADVVVFVGGLTAEVEGEEMRVSYPGFRGGDRTDIELPAVQQRMLEALHATGKPVVLVLTTGSAVAVRWPQQSLPAILLAWYPGQQGGNAVADVLFGDVSPAGRLPVTFYESVDQIPPFDDYAMDGRTYRYFRKEPLYPFGHGLSYARFTYSGLKVSAGTGGAVEVGVDVKNSGPRDGDEVVQLYVRDVEAKAPAAHRELRGFERVHLKAGETRHVTFTLVPSRDRLRYDEGKKAMAFAPGPFEVEVGASSKDVRLRARAPLPD
jgi:beta-glucosidase